MISKINHLVESPEYWFRDWPNKNVPKVAGGIYSIWDQKNNFIYVGMSGREISKKRQSEKPYGLFTRLQSHASGRLSGDQFCVYIANRIIIPQITEKDKQAFISGTLNLDSLTKMYIHDNLKYKFIVLENEKDIFALERHIQQFGINKVKPLLNSI